MVKSFFLIKGLSVFDELGYLNSDIAADFKLKRDTFLNHRDLELNSEKESSRLTTLVKDGIMRSVSAVWNLEVEFTTENQLLESTELALDSFCDAEGASDIIQAVANVSEAAFAYKIFVWMRSMELV
jgi:hypothetical protein